MTTQPRTPSPGLPVAHEYYYFAGQPVDAVRLAVPHHRKQAGEWRRATMADYTYTEDGAGNITSILDATDHAYDRSKFEYDDLNRLVTANSGASLWGTGAYTYDAMGT